jgi:hypothetical protein
MRVVLHCAGGIPDQILLDGLRDHLSQRRHLSRGNWAILESSTPGHDQELVCDFCCRGFSALCVDLSHRDNAFCDYRCEAVEAAVPLLLVHAGYSFVGVGWTGDTRRTARGSVPVPAEFGIVDYWLPVRVAPNVAMSDYPDVIGGKADMARTLRFCGE